MSVVLSSSTFGYENPCYSVALLRQGIKVIAYAFIGSLVLAIGCLSLAVGKLVVQRPRWQLVAFVVATVGITLGLVGSFFSPSMAYTHRPASLPSVFQYAIPILAVGLAFCLRSSPSLRIMSLISFLAVGAFGILAAQDYGSPNRLPYAYHMAHRVHAQHLARIMEAFETPVGQIKPGILVTEHPDPEVRGLVDDREAPTLREYRHLWHSWFTDLYDTRRSPVRYRIVAYDGKTYTLAAEPR